MMSLNSTVSAGPVAFSNTGQFSLIAGPCQMESRQHAFDMAGALKEMTGKLGIGLVYKSSFDKANRTSLTGKRGFGLENSLPVFADIRKEFGLPTLTDVHTEEQCAS
ncbi:MAG: 3-deoxy-8-phosphooctulonate synthase, partial [Pyrinomonadaceae bacterium]